MNLSHFALIFHLFVPKTGAQYKLMSRPPPLLPSTDGIANDRYIIFLWLGRVCSPPLVGVSSLYVQHGGSEKLKRVPRSMHDFERLNAGPLEKTSKLTVAGVGLAARLSWIYYQGSVKFDVMVSSMRWRAPYRLYVASVLGGKVSNSLSAQREGTQ